MEQNRDQYEMDLEWKKIEQNMIKVGLKNGLSDGRDSNFQQSFDKGYEDGFRNGFLLGKSKFTSELNKAISPLLQNIEKGMCVVCQNENENSNVANVRQKQTEVIQTTLENISSP